MKDKQAGQQDAKSTYVYNQGENERNKDRKERKDK